MIVRVALGAVLGAMLVAVIVRSVVMPAAAGVARRVAVGFRMAVGMGLGAIHVRFGVTLGLRRVIMVVVIMPVMVMGVMVMGVIMMVVIMAMGVAGMVAIGMVVVVGAPLGLERPHYGAHCAALPAYHLGQDMVVLDVDRLSRDLGRRMAVADMPGDAHQTQRVFGPNLEQALRRRLHQHETAILQLDSVAIADRGGLVEIEQDAEPAIGLEREAAAVAVVMVERQRVDDAVLPDGGLANDGGGAKHDGDVRDKSVDQRRSIDRGSTTSITAGVVTQALTVSRKASMCDERMCRSISARVSQLS